MEELVELRQYVEQQRYGEALNLIAEMEEMSREDKTNKIRSWSVVLLLHLIKQAAEKRTTRSWDISIWNAAHEIHYVNQRRKAGGDYLAESELRQVIRQAYLAALKLASIEAFEGRYDDQELGARVDRVGIEQQAYTLIAAAVDD